MSHSIFRTLLQHELKSYYRQAAKCLTPLAFYLLVVCLFPFALNAEKTVLQTCAAGIVWIALLLSLLMSFPRLFADDHQEGSLTQYCLQDTMLMPYISAKMLAHAFMHILPCLLLTPILGLLLYLSVRDIEILWLTILLGSPILLLIGSLGAALTLRAGQGSALLALILFPLYIPVLILALNCVTLATAGRPIAGLLAWLCAYACLCIALIPFAIKAILKIGVQ